MKERRPFNILVVNSTLHIGGAEEVIANLCHRLDRQRFNVTVCYLKEKGVVGDKIERQGTEVVGISNASAGSEKTDYFTSFKLRSLIRARHIDLVHSHDVHSFTDCALCRVTMPGLKFVHTFHYGNYPNRDASLQRMEKLFWRVPDALVAVSKQQMQSIQGLYGIPDQRIQTLWNGVDLETAETGGAEPVGLVDQYRQQNRVIIGCINTLIEQKGMFDLIKVASLLKAKMPGKFVILVAGGGHLQASLQREIESKQLSDHLILLGWVKQAARIFLPLIDIFFQPSLWEAMSIVLMEAMGSAKAIVATAVGETPYVLDQGQGIVVEAGQIDEMARALHRLILNPNLRDELGKKARARYEEAFTAGMMAQRYEALYEKLLS